MYLLRSIPLKIRILFLLPATWLILSFLPNGNREQPLRSVTAYYTTRLDSLRESILLFEAVAPRASPDSIRQLFRTARRHYKKIEFLVEYHFAASAQQLNGPALPEAEPSEPAEPQHPSGFQVLEETIYSDWDEAQRQAVVFELSNLHNRVDRLQTMLPDLELTATSTLDAVRLNLYRLITKGITGFDSPVALNSIPEAIATLQASEAVLSFFPESSQVVATIQRAIAYLEAAPGFDGLDRAVLISAYLNPVSRALYQYQVQQRIPFPLQPQAVRFTAQTLFDQDVFDPLFYAPSGTVAATAAQIALGKQLFREPLLSANGLRSCRSCHLPEKAFTDGLALNEALTGHQQLQRNTPTLLNAALQPVQFYDSHIAFLEDQAHDVISNQHEMGGLFEVITAKLNRNKTYQVAFARAYPGGQITAQHTKAALAAYVRSLVALNSRFDQYMRGNPQALHADERKGFNLFAGKAKCATCHFIPLFSGTVPPLFEKMESEVLGIPATADTVHAVQDLDSGKYHLYQIPHQLYAFKTSTVRNTALTAPYMHNGVFKTLEEVMDFYNRGGGAGLKFDLPNQTLPPDPLNLTNEEKKQVIAFLHALTDAGTRQVAGQHPNR